ncbi:MAG: hypothetical protein GQ574_01075 [Crocinitomix sp.]|nr:hypothetical protein [Crocinitomix sp.]
MGKTSYKNTEELIKEIAENVAALQKGELGLNKLNDLVDSGKDLFEQLVILRYKAFDKYGTPEKAVSEKIVKTEAVVEEVAEKKEAEEVDEEKPFDFTGFSSEKKEEEQPSFDFTLDEEQPEVTEPVEKEIEDEANDFEEKIAESVQADEDYDDGASSNSLNESLKQDELSLRKRLQNSPVSDIKTHISIAKKFEYISIMFEGNSDEYDEAIDFLNTCATGKDARLKLNELTTNHSWDLENKSIINFIELVERRYL